MSFCVRRLSDAEKRRVWRLRLPSAASLAAFLAVARPLLGWYETWKGRSERKRRHERRLTVLKRTLLVLIAALFVLLILAGLAKALLSVRILGLDTIISAAGNAPPADENGFTNILLLGQGDETGQDLTDSIMIASLDPGETASAVLLSFPRDLYFLHTDKMDAGRLNSLFRDYRSTLKLKDGLSSRDAEIAAIREIGSELGRQIGLEIHHAVKVDFDAFTQAVDALDGVDVDVPYDIEDREYPDGNYGFEPFMLGKGPRHLDGALALKYARSRHTSSDFDRSARQQQLLAAIGEKAREEADPAMIARLMRIMGEHVASTMTVRDIIGLFDAAKRIDRSRIFSMQLSDRNGLYDGLVEPGGFLYAPPRDLFEGASVLLPVSIPEFPVTWKQLQTLKKLLIDTRPPYLADPAIAVLNAGAPPGTARKLATELVRYGFDVDLITNASIAKQDRSAVSGGKEDTRELAGFFALLLKTEHRPLPADLPADETRTVVILLGKDYRFVPLQDLL